MHDCIARTTKKSADAALKCQQCEVRTNGYTVLPAEFDKRDQANRVVVNLKSVTGGEWSPKDETFKAPSASIIFFNELNSRSFGICRIQCIISCLARDCGCFNASDTSAEVANSANVTIVTGRLISNY